MNTEGKDGRCPDGPGCQPSASAADASSQSGIPNAGTPSLTALGLSHYYDAAEWEATYDAGDLDYAADWLVEEQGYGRGVYEVATLIKGPTLFAGHYPIGWVEGSDPGDIDDWEVRFFESHAHWKRAVASAIEARRAETAQTGSVHESAGPKDDAQPLAGEAS